MSYNKAVPMPLEAKPFASTFGGTSCWHFLRNFWLRLPAELSINEPLSVLLAICPAVHSLYSIAVTQLSL